MTSTRTDTEHAYSADCFCDDCERIGFDIAREERAERAAEHAERLAHRNSHPFTWH